MTGLDELLYAWLAESDDRSFERAFNAYFSLAFPAVIRHLARTAPSDPALLEDIAQDALLRFFDRIGKGRRLAAEIVGTALQTIHPLALGALHERQVCRWTTEVGDFRATAMAFRPAITADDDASAWKQPIRDLAQRIPPLQARGWQLIDQVRIALQWNLSAALPDAASQETQGEATQALDTLEGSDDAGRYAAPCAATVSLAQAVLKATAVAGDNESRLPGANPFVHGTATVVGALPRLRVPTNGYLFETAMSLYLDEYRRRGRRKRGGTGAQPAPEGMLRDPSGAPVRHPLELPLPGTPLDDTVAHDGTDLNAPAPAPARWTATAEPVADDPIRHFEDAEFFQRFYDYLRAPVAEAEAAYEAALTRGRAVAEQRRRDSLAQKFARTVAVLAAVGEGYTQEETARQLGLTRNQVKYVLEMLQDAYARFAAYAARGSSGRSAVGVPSHAD